MAAVEAATTAKQLRVDVTGVGLVEWSTSEFCCILGTQAHWLGLGTLHSGSGIQGGGANRNGRIDFLPTQRVNKSMFE